MCASIRPLSAAVVWLVCLGVEHLRCATAVHPEFSADDRSHLVVLASGHDRMDRAGVALGVTGVSASAESTSGVSALCTVPADLVVHRDLSARRVHPRSVASRAFPQRGHGVDGLGFLASSSSRRIIGRAAPRMCVCCVGTSSPRLSVPARAGGVEPVGLLPRHQFRTARRCGAGVAGARRSGTWCARAHRALGRLAAARCVGRSTRPVAVASPVTPRRPWQRNVSFRWRRRCAASRCQR